MYQCSRTLLDVQFPSSVCVDPVLNYFIFSAFWVQEMNLVIIYFLTNQFQLIGWMWGLMDVVRCYSCSRVFSGGLVRLHIAMFDLQVLHFNMFHIQTQTKAKVSAGEESGIFFKFYSKISWKERYLVMIFFQCVFYQRPSDSDKNSFSMENVRF